MIFLRQSTASQEVPLGRFVDSTDGNTEETGLTIANTDIKIWKTGATTLANKNSGGATHIANGEYYAVFDATDTDTIGPMKITIHVSGALYVQVFCTVLDEAVYDVLFGTTAISTLGGTAQTGDSYAIVNSGTHGNAALKTLIDAVDNFVDTEIADIQARLPAALTADGNIKADTLRVGGTLQTAGDIIGDTNDIQSRLPAALGANGNIKADVRDYNGTAGTFSGGRPEVKLGDVAHGGTSATLRLGASAGTPAFYVTNSAGQAVAFEGSTYGLKLSGTGNNGLLVIGDGTTAASFVGNIDLNGGTSAIVGNLTGSVSGSVGSVGADGITSTSLAASAGTEIGTAVWASATRTLTSLSGLTVDTVTTLTNKTGFSLASTGFDLVVLPANIITTTSIADDAITDAKIAVPAEASGRPTRVLAMLRRTWERFANKRTRNRTTGAVVVRNAADSGDLETQTQSTSGVTDTQTQGS